MCEETTRVVDLVLRDVGDEKTSFGDGDCLLNGDDW